MKIAGQSLGAEQHGPPGRRLGSGVVDKPVAHARVLFVPHRHPGSFQAPREGAPFIAQRIAAGGDDQGRRQALQARIAGR